MNVQQSWVLVRTLVLGLVFFGVAMAIAISVVMLNARVSPAVPWFPVPVLAVVLGGSWWVSRRWDIGWPGRAPSSPGRTYGLALAVTVFGVVLCILQGAGFGMVRAAETVAGVSSPAFQLAYGVTMGVVSAVLAEVTFRGIIQTRYEQILGAWPAILVVAAINTAAHRWGPALEAQWAAYFLSLAALGYLRTVTGSVIPPLVAHGVANFVLGFVLWFAGPLDQGRLLTMGNGLAVAGLTALVIASAWISGRLGRQLAEGAPARSGLAPAERAQHTEGA